MISEVVSKTGIPVRLTDERWAHITEEHCELAGLRSEVLETVFHPERILAGGDGELMAIREVEPGKTSHGGLSRTECRRLYHHRVSYPSHSVACEEEAAMAITDIQEYLKLIPAVNRAPQHAVWLTYDAEADTLYVNYKKPSHATDSEMTDEDVIIRYENNEVIGFTVLHASKRLKKSA